MIPLPRLSDTWIIGMCTINGCYFFLCFWAMISRTAFDEQSHYNFLPTTLSPQDMVSLTLDSLPQSTDYLCPSLHRPLDCHAGDRHFPGISQLSKRCMPSSHVYPSQDSSYQDQTNVKHLIECSSRSCVMRILKQFLREDTETDWCWRNSQPFQVVSQSCAWVSQAEWELWRVVD